MERRSRDPVGPVRLADALGWGSALLGAPMLVAPQRFLGAIGVKADRRTVGWTLAVGAREQLALLNTVAMRQRRIGMWSRAVGDLMDLGLLAAAYRHKRADAGRLRAAMGIVGAFLATDLATAVALTRAEGGDVTAGSTSAGEGAPPEPEGGPLHVRTAVTIRAGEEEVRRAFREHRWSAFDPVALEASGDVRFVSAPGDRGTEVHLDHEPDARGGAVGATAAKLLGRAPDQEIHDELRRFKALVETGVVMGSDKSPEGAAARRQIMHKRRPAQPAGKES